MSSITEIEAAIEKLPRGQVEELAAWLEAVLLRRATPPAVDRWLDSARGAALAGTTTDAVMALTRADFLIGAHAEAESLALMTSYPAATDRIFQL